MQQGRPRPSDLGAEAALATRLGSHRGRKHDPAPGNRIMWEGYNVLTLATMGHRLRDSPLATRQRGALIGLQKQFKATQQPKSPWEPPNMASHRRT